MNASLPVIPRSLFELMADIGPKWGSDIRGHSKLMIDGFSELLADAPKDGEVARDIAYGAHPRQVLDVYSPRGARAAPIVVFAHGGAYVDGNKDRSGEIYANLCWYLARNGVICVNIEYRLAPEFKYPSASEDVGAAVGWTRANIARFGGDPGRVFVMGHSAGAAHVGCYAYDRRLHPPEGSGIVGLIVVSGRVRAENLPENPNARKVEAYYGVDPARMEQGSVVNHVSAKSVPTMIGIGEFENPLLDVHCAELFHRLAQVQRRAPRIVRLAGYNHTSTIAHFNTAEDRLGREILEFIRIGR